MKPTIELDYEQVDEIVAQTLKESIQDLLDNPYFMYNSHLRTLEQVNSMLETLEYYMTGPDFKEFTSSIREDAIELSLKVLKEANGD